MIFNKNNKISQKFHLISFLLLLVTTTICITFFFYDNYASKKQIRNILTSESQRLISKFDDSLSYTKHIMGYIGDQIQRNNAATKYNFINQLLISYRVPNNELMSWSTFSWVDHNGHLIISSNQGVNLKDYGDLLKRDYMPKTVLYPKTIQTGSPVYGVKSKLWSVPIGYGVVSDKGEYLGAVVTGIVTDGLKNKLSEIIKNDQVLFILIDERSSDIVTKSDNIDEYIVKKILHKIELNKSEQTILDDLFYYKKMSNYPYSIVTLYLPINEYNQWFTYLLLISIITFLVVLPVVLFKKKLILPIIELSKIAEDISSDKNPKFMKKSNIKEIDNLAKQLENIQQYKIDLLRAKDAQSNFFLNMSHELRSPLTGVISFSELIKKEIYGPIKNEYNSIVNQIYDSGNHLLLMIDDLLSFSKINKGKMKLYEEDVDVANEIQNLVNKLSAEADRKNVKINIVSCNLILKADKKMFQSILINLLSNAIKFSYENSDINIVTKFDDKNNLEIVITDCGIGIKEEDMDLILEEYGQARDCYKNHDRQGTGLGIPLVQKMIALHQGKLKIESIYEKETVVTATFPNNRIIKNL